MDLNKLIADVKASFPCASLSLISINKKREGVAYADFS